MYFIQQPFSSSHNTIIKICKFDPGSRNSELIGSTWTQRNIVTSSRCGCGGGGAVKLHCALFRRCLTDLRAFSQSEREAEAFHPAVRVDHHVCDRVIRVGVLRCGKLQWNPKLQIQAQHMHPDHCHSCRNFLTIASEPCCSKDVGNLTSLTVKFVILCNIFGTEIKFLNCLEIQPLFKVVSSQVTCRSWSHPPQPLV